MYASIVPTCSGTQAKMISPPTTVVVCSSARGACAARWNAVTHAGDGTSLNVIRILYITGRAAALWTLVH